MRLFPGHRLPVFNIPVSLSAIGWYGDGRLAARDGGAAGWRRIRVAATAETERHLNQVDYSAAVCITDIHHTRHRGRRQATTGVGKGTGRDPCQRRDGITLRNTQVSGTGV